MRERQAQWQYPIRPKQGTTIGALKRTLGRCGMSVSRYDIEQVKLLEGPGGRAAYGSSPHDGRGRPLHGKRGRPLIQLSDLALRDIQTAIMTVFHEVAHHRAYRAIGNGGTEAAAEQYAQRMFDLFVRSWI